MLLNNINIDQCIGVHIEITGRDTYIINACSVKRSDNKIHIDQSIPSFDSLNDLFKSLSTKSVISLNLTGKGILHKKVQLVDGNQVGIDAVLPGANPDDFYLQNFESGENTFISLIRKEEGDKWITRFREAGFNIIRLSLGPFAVSTILNQLNVYGEELIFHGHHIIMTEDYLWVSYHYNKVLKAPFDIKAGMETLEERLILPYATAFGIVLGDRIDQSYANVPLLSANFNELNNNKKLKIIAVIIGGVFFLLLAANMVLFSWLYAKNDKLTSELSRSSRDSEGIRELAEKVSANDALLTQFGWDEGLSKSLLIDNLASLLPEGLVWKQIDINPIDIQESRQQKSVRFNNRSITIVGNAAAIIDVNEWIARVKILKWVKNVRLENYSYNNESNTGQFKIFLNY